METWAPIPGYEESYEVSDMGRVRSLPRRVLRDGGVRAAHFALTPGGLLSPWATSDGYHAVALGKRVTRLVHLLVLESFVGPRPDGLLCRHMNGNGTDNRLENIRWGTPSENNLDKVRHGTDHNVRKTRCPQSHPYSAENTYVCPRTGRRSCRACRKAAWKRHRDKTVRIDT